MLKIIFSWFVGATNEKVPEELQNILIKTEFYFNMNEKNSSMNKERVDILEELNILYNKIQ